MAEFIGTPSINFIDRDYASKILNLRGLEKFNENILLGIRPENLEFVEGNDFEIVLIENFSSTKYYYLENKFLKITVMTGREFENQLGEYVSVKVKDESGVNIFSKETGMLLNSPRLS